MKNEIEIQKAYHKTAKSFLSAASLLFFSILPLLSCHATENPFYEIQDPLIDIEDDMGDLVTVSDYSGNLESSSHPPLTNSTLYHPTIELKAGYFFFADDKMRDVYDRGGWDVQLSSSYPVWKWLQIYASVEFMEKSGKSLNGYQKTWIWQVPLSLGLRSAITLRPKVQYYFTIGPRYSFVHQHNDSSNVDRNMNQNGIGGFMNTGFTFFPHRHLLLDFFGEYSYIKMHFHPDKTNVHGRSIQVGGLVFGGGIGYVF